MMKHRYVTLLLFNINNFIRTQLNGFKHHYVTLLLFNIDNFIRTQLNGFKHGYVILLLFNCVRIKLLMLNSNIQNPLRANKWLILNRTIRVKILETNCVQTIVILACKKINTDSFKIRSPTQLMDFKHRSVTLLLLIINNFIRTQLNGFKHRYVLCSGLWTQVVVIIRETTICEENSYIYKIEYLQERDC